MNSFGLKHGFIPHGNRFPECSSSDSSVKVEVAESEAPTLELLNEDEIAARYNMRVDRHAYSMYNSVTATVGLIDGD
jgi:hypothetical protein